MRCTSSCVDICTVNAIFMRLALNVNTFVATRNFTGANVVAMLVNTIDGVVLSPVFVFNFGLNMHNTTLTAVLSRTVSYT